MSGLTEAEVRSLSPAQRRDLTAWTLTVCGVEDTAAPFIPNAVRRLPLEHRLAMMNDSSIEAAWMERERRRVVADLVYFTEAYGHLRPPKGASIPFDFWPEQRQVLAEIRDHLLQLWLKARQLGMTWLALHDAFHLLAFEPTTPFARVLVLSKHGGDASKLLERTRSIRDHLPPFLRPDEASDTRRSKSRFGIAGRGEMLSLAGTPDAARSESATLALCDEFGFVKNQQAGDTWTALQPTLGEDGRAIVLSTGNGPAETPGDGQAFAQLVDRAMSGAEDPDRGRTIHFVFLPASTDPRRSAAWREREVENYLTIEAFEAEHPETVEQALAGQPGTKVYPLAGINAAAKLGRAFDSLVDLDLMPPPAGGGLTGGIDWGEQTVGLILWPLERGGFYVADEIVHAHREPTELVDPMIDAADRLEHPLVAVRFDAAGVQSQRSFIKTARRRLPRLRSTKIPFSTHKDETLKYNRRLFRRCERGDETQIFAISARCVNLLRQLRGLEFADDDSGKVDKGDDHGPDALIAGVALTAARFRDATDPHDDEENAE